MNFQLLTPFRRAFATTLAAVLAGCGIPGPKAPITSPVPGQLSSAVPETKPGAMPRASNAASARAYRQDAARHVYARNAHRVYGGKLPALLYAVGTLEVNLDANGKVLSMHWMRAPKHAPEVIAEIERTVLEASPFPAAAQLGRVTWTDTWLWDKGGHFQLDTLSEGQL